MNQSIEAIIIAHNRNLIEHISTELVKSEAFIVVGNATRLEEGIRMTEALGPDVVFMDPTFEDVDALEKFAAKKLGGVKLILLSQFASDAVRAYEYEVYDFVTLPLAKRRLKKVLSRLENSILETEGAQVVHQALGMILLPTHHGFDLISMTDIIRCEAAGCYTHFHIMEGGEVVIRTVSRNLKEYAPLLEGNHFFRVHRSHLVNLQYVASYYKGRGGYLRMADDSQVEVSVRRKSDLMRFLGSNGA